MQIDPNVLLAMLTNFYQNSLALATDNDRLRARIAELEGQAEADPGA